MKLLLGFAIVGLVVACRGAGHAANVEDSTRLASDSEARIGTSPGGRARVIEADSFVHLQGWTDRDSLVGAFIKLGHARHGQEAPDGTLPAALNLGKTGTSAIRTALGPPLHIRSTADTSWLEYASPFIGPDEAVIFVVVRDTLRRVRWHLYSE